MPDAAVRREIGTTPVDVVLGLLMFSSTLYFASNALLLLVLVALFFDGRPRQLRPSLILAGGFSAFALLNILVHLPRFDFEQHASSPAVLLVALGALLAPRLTPGALRVFVLAVCAEVLVGCYEYSIGQVALTAAQSELARQDLALESELLYDLRVFGLSGNSSLLAEKVFLAATLVLTNPTLVRPRWLVLSMLAAGLFVSFNRTAIAATLLLVLLEIRLSELGWRRALVLVTMLALAAGTIAWNLDEILLQFARGNVDELSYSELSRLYFWERSIELLQDQPAFGNGSLTFRIEDPVTGIPQHAHNSFLMLTATHGLVPAGLMLTFVAANLNSRNWRPVAALLTFSLTQYLVFWNLSVPDMMLFWLLAQGHASARPHAVTARRTTGPIPLSAA